VPSPFSRISIRWGVPFHAARDGNAADDTALLEAALTNLQSEADRAVDRHSTQAP